MNEQDILRLYCSLMEEVKIRIGVINHTYRDKLPPHVVREICYLQFRFICEIIALACLAAHSEIEETQAVKHDYQPHKIIKRLQALNPHFYPQPAERRRIADSKCTILASRSDIKYLSKKELLYLWGKAGNILHRGSMVKVLKAEQPGSDNYADIVDWTEKITGLLNSHWITVVENKKGLLVTLVSTETNKASATLLEFDTLRGVADLATMYAK